MLRDLVEDDVAALREVFDAEVTRFLGFGVRDETETREYVRHNMELAAADPREKFLLVIEAADQPGMVVGTIALLLESPGVASVGFAVRRSAWGRGYATAALQTLLEYAFGVLGLRRVWGGHEPDNPASGKVMRRAGMRREGVRRRDVLLRGEWQDTVVYAAAAGDWPPTAG